MDIAQQFLMGLSYALTPTNLGFCLLGAILGTLVGVLPGLGPAAAMALLLPVTYAMPPAAAIIMLAGIYYGAMYGGSTTSILLNVPGESASVVTCLDGYKMARQGRAGPALGMSAFASFIAGGLGVLGLILVGPPLADFALKFGAAEYFSLAVLGLVLVTFLSGASVLKGLIMAVLGLLLGTVGIDPISAYQRFTFDILVLADGFDFVPVAMGLFGLGEILVSLGQETKRDILKTRLSGLLPTAQDWLAAKWALVRGSVLGFFVGALPGGGATIASFAAYAVEKRLSRHPEKFGTGVIEGVAAPEAANNSAATGAFIPLFTLGIPSNPVTAMIFAALLLHGLRPGPLMFKDNPDVIWTVIASMYIGNVILLVINLPLIGLLVQMLRVPYGILAPLIVVFCVVGAYSVTSSVAGVWMLIAFGAVGYVARRLRFEAAPLILALVLGPLVENSLRQALLYSRGDLSIFVTRPISAILLVAAALILIAPPVIRRLRRQDAGPGGPSVPYGGET
jgi:putative tricarboxylic transport membrane protein